MYLVAQASSRLSSACQQLAGCSLVRTIATTYASGEALVHLKFVPKGNAKKACPLVLMHQESAGMQQAANQVQRLHTLLVAAQLADVHKDYFSNFVLWMPYLPYTRQSAPESTDISMAKRYLQLCAAAGFSSVYTVQPHVVPVPHVPDRMMVYAIDVTSLWVSALQQELASISKDQLVVVSPDHGGYHRAYTLAQQLGAAVAKMSKTRDAQGVPLCVGLPDVRGKVVIVVDDIFDTGKTAASAVQALVTAGAQTVYGCFAHVLDSQQMFQTISKSFCKVWITDTVMATQGVEACATVLSVAPLLLQATTL